MKKIFIGITVAFLFLPVFFSDISTASPQWKLISEDESGNRMYIDEASIKKDPDSHVVTVTMRFDLRKSETKMLFVDEIDCAKSLVRRLSLKMLNPVCTGDSVTYSTTFEGRWDVISEGLERQLFEAVCR